MASMTSAGPTTMDGDSTRDLDRLIESVYADAFQLDWLAFRENALRLLCEWTHARGAAWCIHVRDNRHGEFACWPPGFPVSEGTLAALEFTPGHREQMIATSPEARPDVLALAMDHRGAHLRSVLALQPSDATLDGVALRRAAGHLVQAASLALRQFVARDEWLINMGRASRGSAALVDARGAIYVASERFRELLALEFGDRDFARLPFPLSAERLDEPAPFQIGSLHFRVQAQGALFLLNARRPHPLDVLSPREQEIARALALGKTFKSVAREYEIAISTVANHASRIYRKLGIYRREELVELLRRAVEVKAA
ncbi:helix-turn-helix transcriptional regulator [Solimonas terrae]|uniref:Response regulator transcription factor n=1 Tax=Solimonas terrae TaxID=1396819 RepID=A0A6M2BQE8_9GAMM|nr:LuxR C-terminal-related transcriptional regulator [Solimonas terrae]NGY04574.1 response regulator transcription factor [Solimonas terrae]